MAVNAWKDGSAYDGLTLGYRTAKSNYLCGRPTQVCCDDALGNNPAVVFSALRTESNTTGSYCLRILLCNKAK